MFDQFQQFTDIAQNFQGAQWGVQIQEQFQQHFQNWFNTETVEPAKSTFSSAPSRSLRSMFHVKH